MSDQNTETLIITLSCEPDEQVLSSLKKSGFQLSRSMGQVITGKGDLLAIQTLMKTGPSIVRVRKAFYSKCCTPVDL